MPAIALTAYIVAGLLLLLAAHPFTTYPVSLWLFMRRTKNAYTPPAEPTRIAVCMSAFNEEAVIVDKVESLLAMVRDYGPATIHIYCDGCTDRTVDLLEPYRDRIDLVVSTDRMGKTHGMNVLLERSDAPLVKFTDANVVAGDDTLALLAAPFADPTIGCTTARLIYSNPAESATSLAGSLYWRAEEAVKQIESETIGVIGVDGASFVVRRELYRAAPPELIDDLYVTLNVLACGAGVIRVPEAVVQERSAVFPEEEYRRKARITCQAMNVHRALWAGLSRLPARQVYGYVSHRLVKWLIPFLLLGAGAAFVCGLTLQFGWIAGGGLLLAGAVILALGALGVPLCAFVYSAVLSLAGVAKGVLLSIFSNQTYTIWEPVQTVRSALGAEQ